MALNAIGRVTADLESSTHFQMGKQLWAGFVAWLVAEFTAYDDRPDTGYAEARIMGTVRVILGAMIGLAVGIVVLNEVFSLNSVSNSTGPFSEVISQIENIGGAALGLIVIGLLVAAANQIMSFFGGGGF